MNPPMTFMAPTFVPKTAEASLESYRPVFRSDPSRIQELFAFALLFIACLFGAPSSLACRYSVRDTGFVDLGGDPYRLILHLAPNAPSHLRLDFEHAAAAVLLDANITLSVQSDPPSPTTRLLLRSPDQRTLTLAEDPAFPNSRAGVVDLLERAALSRVRAQLHDELLRAYAVIVLVEGQEPDANQRARQTLNEAAAAISRLLPSMPKPVDVPPPILTIPLATLAAESVLVWGLGMDPQPARDPRVAIVFGRGRRVGDFLEGALITRTVVQDRLAIIGQDCECELDRSFLQGPVIPARWDSGRQRAAAAALGFDPENPLIRAEISRIVLKGPANPGARATRTTSGAFDALALGYSEEPIELAAATLPDASPDPAPDPDSTSAPTTAPPLQPSAKPKATVAVLAVWFALSGLSLAAVFAGVSLLRRSRKKDRP